MIVFPHYSMHFHAHTHTYLRDLNPNFHCRPLGYTLADWSLY